MVNYESFYFKPDINGGWILYEKKQNLDNKKERLEIVCYPSNLRGCIREIMRLECKRVFTEKDFTIQQALEKYDEIYKHFEDVLNNKLKEL